MSDDDEIVSPMITSAQAAELCGMTTYAFRKAMTRQEMLIKARIKAGDSRWWLLDREKVLAWNEQRKPRKKRKP